MAASHQDGVVADVQGVRPARTVFNAHVDGYHSNNQEGNEGYNQDDDERCAEGTTGVNS